MVGVVSLEEGLARAEDAGLDLVEVSPNASPPVCKILDYGKFRYRDQRKAREAKKRQRTFEVKEVKIRPNIDGHDYAVKMRSITKFLDYGNKVKVTLRFRGRELAHQELGAQVLERIRAELSERVRIEQMPSMDGRQMVMVVAPVQGLGHATQAVEASIAARQRALDSAAPAAVEPARTPASPEPEPSAAEPASTPASPEPEPAAVEAEEPLQAPPPDDEAPLAAASET